MKNALLSGFALLFSLSLPVQADVVIVNGDGAGEGFNDPTVVSAVGGNTATTLGQQRLNVFQRAADILNSTYDISVVVKVNAQFNALTCNSSSAVLGSAGPAQWHFEWDPSISNYRVYPDALYNQMNGTDVDTAAPEISAEFNSSIDNNNNCLNGVNWYYGYDAPTGYDSSLLSVVLHEVLHGMGFLSLLQSNGASAATAGGQDVFDPYSYKLKDAVSGNMLTSMAAGSRASVMTSVNNLVWAGTQANAKSGDYSSGVNAGQMKMYAPASYESGSSTSHFDKTVSPNEVMEPVYTEFLDDPGLATELMADIGWTLAASSNTAPVLSAIGNRSLNEDASLSITLSATDGESDPLTYSLTSVTSSLGASISGSTLSINPSANYNGSGTLTVQVSDGSLTDSETITVTVNAVNDAPVLATISNQTTNEDTAKVVSLSATDVDGDSLTYSVTAAATGLSTSVSGSSLTITPDANWYGSGSITVQVSDGSLTDSQAFTLTVNSVNDAPVLAAIGNQTLAEDGTLNVSLSASDADGDSLSYSITSASSTLGASISGSTLSITPDADYNGSGSITVRVSDGGLTDSETISVTVSAVNDAPVIGSLSDVTLDLGGSSNITLSATDVDGDSLMYSASSGDTGVVTTSVSGQTLTLTATGQSGDTATITVQVTDGSVSDSTQFVVTLSDTIISLNAAGSSLNDGESTNAPLSAVSLNFSGGTSPYSVDVYYDGSSRNDLLSGSSASFSLAMPTSGAFAGVYQIDVSDQSGGSATYYLERPLRLSADTSPLLAGSQAASMLIEGAPAFTGISLSSDSFELAFANNAGNSISVVNAPDNSASFNAARVWLDAGDADTATVTTSAANIPDTDMDVTIAERRRVTLRVRDDAAVGIASASVELDDERAEGWGLATDYTTAGNGTLSLDLPDVDVVLNISATGFEDTTLVLGAGSTSATVTLDSLAVSYLLHGKITASGFSFGNEMPEVLVVLSDGNEVSAETEMVSSTRVNYEWSPENTAQQAETLIISHSLSGSVEIQLTPSADEEIVDISLSALSVAGPVDNGSTDNGSTDNGSGDGSTTDNSSSGGSSKKSSGGGLGAAGMVWTLLLAGLALGRRKRLNPRAA